MTPETRLTADLPTDALLELLIAIVDAGGLIEGLGRIAGGAPLLGVHGLSPEQVQTVAAKAGIIPVATWASPAPRERAVPCSRCRRDTWEPDAVCSACR